MRLRVFEEDAQVFKDKLFPGEVEQIACYKVLLKPNKDLKGDSYKSPLFPHLHNWALGWNVANKVGKLYVIWSSLEEGRLFSADSGIHVFLDIESAKKFIHTYMDYYAIILVGCLKEDLILCSDNYAVFQKVFVSSFDEIYP